MTWQPELDELKKRQTLALEMGGPEKVARHKANGKLTVRERIAALCDAGSFREIGSVSGFAAYDADNALTSFTPTNQIIGRGSIDARTVAVSADDFTVRGGANDGGVREKLVYVEKMANQLHLPVVHLVDIPGFVIGVAAEQAATIRYGARAMAAIYQATVPWCSILVRRAFGVAGAAHQSTGRFNIRYAWHSGEWGSLPIAGGLEAAYKAELERAPDPAAKLAEIETRLKQYTSPFRTAEQFLVEEIIDPRATRGLLCDFANLAAPLRVAGASGFGMRP